MTSSNLKIIACLIMLIDHIGVLLFPQYFLLRIIGRLAFPIFAFLIVEGYFHTKDLKKYFIRLGLFAMLSEVPFDRAFNHAWLEFGSQNVFFTLFIGLIAIAIYDKYARKSLVIAVVGTMLCVMLNALVRGDYSMIGVLVILGFYHYRNQQIKILLWLLIINGIYVALQVSNLDQLTLRASAQLFELLALPIIFVYNGKKGLRLKYLFYIFYPTHLLILYTITLMN
ncbi:MAG: hypothetical protein CVU84_15675 [Firmicutes bacterium HGW-Firmicutes-1]|jgi:hypothetical protein|nr:MAG: hypothetical protein CVU84_15675 [Firmicutes bacterium HGW-Firmicutes-1]